MFATKARNERTELEFCVLGAIWLHGPCSAYVIRREFAQSSSSYWSSSAGSIYPAIQRLLSAGLVAEKADPSDGRGTRDVAVTSKGKRALQSWIAELPDWTGKATLDAVRARMNFMAVLASVEAQRDFVQRAEANTRVQMQALKLALKKTDSPSGVEYLTTLGSVYELEGRIRWLRAVRKALAKKKPHPARIAG